MDMIKNQYHHGDLKNALIRAGAEILYEEGVGALTLRKVAARAGVSHSAPYAHFTDKQALIAAISTDGFQKLFDLLSGTMALHRDDPAALLLEVAWSYLQFAQEDPARFKVMFSGILKEEHQYPELVAMSHKTFSLVVELVTLGQQAGLLHPGAQDAIAVSVWSLVHGFSALIVEGQISRSILQKSSQKDLLRQVLNQITRLKLAE